MTLNVTGMRDAHSIWFPRPSIDRSSIAVLPFTSRSTDPQNQLFADGIHDDLLTQPREHISAEGHLSYIGNGISGHDQESASQVAEELSVGTVLEGAVQRDGDNVRITAQLIDAATDDHIWANSYDRPTQLQRTCLRFKARFPEEIARALKATLSNEEQLRLTNIPTDSLAAYNLIQSGSRQSLQAASRHTVLKAREQFEAAIELDPNYADAYAGLADSVLLILNNHQAISLDEAFNVAEASLDKALSINPDLG